MAISSINSLTKLRLTGLASGMDTDSIIKQMMQIEQLKINRQHRAKTTLQWRQESFNNIISDLKTFRQDFTRIDGAKTMMKEAVYNTFKAEVTGNKSNAVTVSTTTNAKVGLVTIDQVYALAKGAEATSTSTNKATLQASRLYNDLEEGDLGPNSDMTLEELNQYLKVPLSFATETVTDDGGTESTSKYIAFSINGTEFKFTSDTKLRDMADQITDSEAGVTARVDWLNDGLKFVSKTPGENIEIKGIAGNAVGNASSGQISAFGLYDSITYCTTQGVSAGTSLSGAGGTASDRALKDLRLAQPLIFENGEISFSINGRSFSFKETDTLGHMMNTINGDSSANAEMSYSELTDTFSIKTKTTGLGITSNLTIVNHTGNAFEGGGRSAFGIAASTYNNGSNAVIKINGTVIQKTSNDFTIDGIRYQLNKVTQPGDEPIDITVTRDIQPAVDSIKEFISGYNAMVTKLQGLITERKSRDESGYVPLTEDEKAEMTEKQIEHWEEIAKKGLLKSDSGIQSLLSRLRGALYETVNSVGLTPADIGLEISTYFKNGELSLSDGQIELDEDKLRAALEKDPNAVMRLFTDMSFEDDRNVEYKESGLMMRIGIIFDDYTKGPGDIALESIENSLRLVNEKITTMQDRMLAKEERLYNQYAAMETALSKIQSQSDWLSSMLGSNK